MTKDADKIAVVNKSGKILCIDEDRELVFLSLEEVTLDNILILWSKSPSVLESFLSGKFFKFKGEKPDIDSSCFLLLEIHIISEEEGTFWIG